MNSYAKVIELVKSYPDESELADIINTLCEAIGQYDGSFGDMPLKRTDLNNACSWLLHLVENDIQYFRDFDEHTDESIEKLSWYEQNRPAITAVKDSL